MKIDCVEEGLCLRHLDIEVPAETVAEAFERNLQHFSRTLKLPGFRKGKIPKELVKQRFRSDILNEVAQDLVPGVVERAIAEKGLHPIDEPRIGNLTVEEGSTLRFRASFEVMPRIEVRDYRGLEVVERRTEVSDEEIEKRLDTLRERAARFDPVEGRGARDGDFVLGSIQESPIGGGRAGRIEAAVIEIGKHAYHPTIHEKLQNARPGDTVRFKATFPADHRDRAKAGKTYDIEVTVNEIKEKVLPELDDELAKDLGNFGTLVELREHVRQQAETEARAADEQHLRAMMIEKLVEKNSFDPPQSLVEQELDRRVEELARTFVDRGLDPEGSGVDWRAIRENQRQAGVQSVRAAILMDRIAEQEGAEVTDAEVDLEVERIASQLEKSVPVVRAQLQKEGGIERLRRRIRRDKTFDLLRQSARIQKG